MNIAQSLCDPVDYTVHGILQARILEWVAFPFFRDLPNPGIEPKSPTLQADSLPAESQGKPLICKMIKYLEHVKIPHRSFLRLLLKASSSAVCPRSLMFCFQISAFFLLQILILQAWSIIYVTTEYLLVPGPELGSDRPNSYLQETPSPVKDINFTQLWASAGT